jgi:hypothetical protein
MPPKKVQVKAEPKQVSLIQVQSSRVRGIVFSSAWTALRTNRICFLSLLTMSDKPPVLSSDANASQQKDNVDEAPLQAVILADSYNRRFEVLCSDTPRILLPLCSTPLLSWTLESLSLSKVRQVFVFCGVHADKVKEYVE